MCHRTECTCLKLSNERQKLFSKGYHGTSRRLNSDKMRFRLAKKNLFLLLCVSLAVWTLLLSTRALSVSERQGANGGLQRSRVEVGGSLPELTASIHSVNHQQLVRNVHKFPLEPELVVVVQVHEAPQHLRLLVESLEKAAQVHRFLLVFSHGFFSAEIDAIVQGITFCKVLQIYFPFSTQLFPTEFPGQDPRDCQRNTNRENARRSGCLNAEHPDVHGHYREAGVTQRKHHWWWKLHFVWERVNVMQGYDGSVLLLEENNYVLPDLFHFYTAMADLKKSSCQDCDLLALGSHQDRSNLSNHVSTGWMSTKTSVGLALDRDVYYKLMGCAKEFCTYDDYNWDWTLQHLSGSCLSKPLKVLAAQGGRVLHTGDGGPGIASQKGEEALEMAKDGLFPPSLVLGTSEAPHLNTQVKNGGWGDVRDHVLCRNYAKLL
ncbi:alpha-1,6-mannosyl-glycoprotein 2-beta-N-acetylglucosaminyltransferase [Nerophis ophidion]|uniref:alpha-1,6-mannosyl-glycoprotein 2-beta-N-acetylglucosaminyltransferase n=1 Tax=Nerophis ophidion TaxID=159077 RepID=UPI002ADF6305|nr:alpha-1,6-mannosyl-glycoprotein 2-beta-N-acetylglucosaminyltransferase [Nerophis ophidion]